MLASELGGLLASALAALLSARAPSACRARRLAVSDAAARRDKPIGGGIGDGGGAGGGGGGAGGLGVSLFARLATMHPRAVSRLSVQFRMAAPIMRICNELVYADILTCGDPRVGSATLERPRADELPKRARTATEAWAAAQAWAVHEGSAGSGARAAGTRSRFASSDGSRNVSAPVPMPR